MSNRLRCMVVDDEPLAIQLLQEYISNCPSLEFVCSSENPIHALELLKGSNIDVLFLDIQMPVLTGMELVKTMSSPPSIIFTTAYREFAVESYELDAIDYLLKPITFNRFLKAINKLNEYLKTKDNNPNSEQEEHAEFTYLNVNKRYVKVIYDEILYIESVKDYIHVHTVNDKVVTKEKIGEFEHKLPKEFIRIHRSFIVNRNKLTAFTSHDVEIGKKEIPIGASYKEKLIKILR